MTTQWASFTLRQPSSPIQNSCGLLLLSGPALIACLIPLLPPGEPGRAGFLCQIGGRESLHCACAYLFNTCQSLVITPIGHRYSTVQRQINIGRNGAYHYAFFFCSNSKGLHLLNAIKQVSVTCEKKSTFSGQRRCLLQESGMRAIFRQQQLACLCYVSSKISLPLLQYCNAAELVAV